MAFLCQSPILFTSLNEVCEDADDVVFDSSFLESSKQNFGACLKTCRACPEDEQIGKRFCHTLHGIDSSKDHGLFDKLREGDELLLVNDNHVSSWSHDALIKTIQDIENEVKFTFHRKIVKDVRKGLVKETDMYIEVVFFICNLGSDKGMGGTGEHGREDVAMAAMCLSDILHYFSGNYDDAIPHIKRITVNVLKKIYYSPRLKAPRFNGTSEVKIRHGAIQSEFLMVEKEKPVMKQIQDSTEAYIFTMFTYFAFDENEGKERQLLALQCRMNHKFLMCNIGSKRLSLVKDEDINADMTNMASNSPCLFFIIQNDDGETFFFESVAYPDNYLFYDKIDLLRVEKLDAPPTSEKFKNEEYIRRNFTFALC